MRVAYCGLDFGEDPTALSSKGLFLSLEWSAPNYEKVPCSRWGNHGFLGPYVDKCQSPDAGPKDASAFLGESFDESDFSRAEPSNRVLDLPLFTIVGHRPVSCLNPRCFHVVAVCCVRCLTAAYGFFNAPAKTFNSNNNKKNKEASIYCALCARSRGYKSRKLFTQVKWKELPIPDGNSRWQQSPGPY